MSSLGVGTKNPAGSARGGSDYWENQDDPAGSTFLLPVCCFIYPLKYVEAYRVMHSCHSTQMSDMCLLQHFTITKSQYSLENNVVACAYNSTTWEAEAGESL